MSIQQTGGEGGQAIATWENLRRPCASNGKDLLLRELAKVSKHADIFNVLDVRTKEEMIVFSKSIFGITTTHNGGSHPNPFVTGGPLDKGEPAANNNNAEGIWPVLSKRPRGEEVAQLFRTVVEADLDSARAIIVMVKAMPETAYAFSAVKSIFTDAFDNESKAKVLNAWRPYTAVQLSDLDPAAQTAARKHYTEWWGVVEQLHARIVQALTDCICESSESDVEKLLYEWQSVSLYFKRALNKEEVLLRERVLYDKIAKICDVGWNKRHRLLMKISLREEFGLGDTVSHSEFEMSEAENYEEFSKLLLAVMKRAEYRGIEFGVRRGDARMDRRLEADHSLGPRVEVETVKSCNYCKGHGHWKSECPVLVAKSGRPSLEPRPPNWQQQKNGLVPQQQREIGYAQKFANQDSLASPAVSDANRPPPTPIKCYSCNETGHIAPHCPRKQQSTWKDERSTNTGNVSDGAKLQPGYVTRSGRQAKQPQRYGVAMVTTLDEKPGDETLGVNSADEEDEDDEVVEKHEARFVCHTIRQEQSSLDVALDAALCTTNPVESIPQFVPEVKVRVDSVEGSNEFSGILDSCSGLNFIGRTAFASLLRAKHIAVREDGPRLILKTMSGTGPMENNRLVDLSITISDDQGNWSDSHTEEFYIFGEDHVPGGYDFLLSAQWFYLGRASIITGKENVVIRISKEETRRESEVQTEDVYRTGTNCLYTFPVTTPEIEESEDVPCFLEVADEIRTLKEKSTTTGPLSKLHLEYIWAKVDDPPVGLSFISGMESPPAVREGFPAPADKINALRTLLSGLEKAKIIREVPRGTGKFTSPGFLVRKGQSDKFRLVCDYTALNSRLREPSGSHFNTVYEMTARLPSSHVWYAVLDIKDAFFRKAVSPSFRKYLNIRCFGIGEFEWLRMPQGLSCAPAYWIALIDQVEKVLLTLLDDRGIFPELNHIRDSVREAMVIAYADDLLVSGTTYDSVEALRLLLIQVLNFGEMFVPLEKMQLTSRRVEILGLELCDGMIGPTQARIEQIRALPKPQNRDHLRSVMGVLNYVKSTIRPVDGLMPLQNLLKTKVRWVWGEEEDSAWDTVVQGIRALPISQFSLVRGVENVKDYQLVVATDASCSGYGWVCYAVPRALLPSDPTSPLVLRDLAPGSRLLDIGHKQFDNCQMAYAVHDKEAMACFLTLKRVRNLIYLFDDCLYLGDNVTTLSRFRSLAQSEKGDTTRSRRWLRWVSDLADLLICRSEGGRCEHLPCSDRRTGFGVRTHARIRFQHLSGPDNDLCDWLSRYFALDVRLQDQATQTDAGDSFRTVLNTRPVTTSLGDVDLLPLLSKWETDTTTKHSSGVDMSDIWATLRTGATLTATSEKGKRYWQKVEQCLPRFEIHENGCLLFRAGPSLKRIVVPNVIFSGERPLRVYLIWFTHEGDTLSAHRGVTGCCESLRRSFYWPKMDTDIYNYIRACEGCLISKSNPNSTSGTFTSRYLTRVNELLITDFAGPLDIVSTEEGKFRYVLLVVDAFSGFCLLRPTVKKDAKTVAHEILGWISLFGTPEAWTHDSDPAFTSNIASELRRLVGLKNNSSPTYSPMSQGSVERLVRTVKGAINCFSVSHHGVVNWPTILRGIQWTQNASRNGVSKVSAFEMMLGRQPRDLLANEVSFIGNEENPDSANHEEYVHQLKQHLEMIRSYWQNKTHEMRCIASDDRIQRLAHSTPLEIGQSCLRISYINGKRSLHGQVTVVEKSGTNSYKVRDNEDGSLFLCHGYQLVPKSSFSTAPDVFGPDGPSRAESDLHRSRATEIRRALRSSPPGTILRYRNRGRLCEGELYEVYVRGNACSVIQYTNSRRPHDSRINDALENIALSDITEVGGSL